MRVTKLLLCLGLTLGIHFANASSLPICTGNFATTCPSTTPDGNGYMPANSCSTSSASSYVQCSGGNATSTGAANCATELPVGCGN